MKISEFLFEKMIFPILIGFGGAIGMVVAEEVREGSWLEWLEYVPWSLFWIIIALWIVIVFIYGRIRSLNEGSGFFFLSGSPLYGYSNLGVLPYSDALWIIRAENDWRERPNYSNVDVTTPPLCPKCKTELDESRKFLGGWNWKCPNEECKFSKWKRNSFITVEEQASKVARAEVRRWLAEQKSDS